jgi:hypothetical protein
MISSLIEGAAKYPNSTFFICYTTGLSVRVMSKTGGKFLDWILTKEGQECIKQAGVFPVGGIIKIGGFFYDER